MGNLDYLKEYFCNKRPNDHPSSLIIPIESHIMWKNLAREMKTKVISTSLTADNRVCYNPIIFSSPISDV